MLKQLISKTNSKRNSRSRTRMPLAVIKWAALLTLIGCGGNNFIGNPVGCNPVTDNTQPKPLATATITPASAELFRNDSGQFVAHINIGTAPAGSRNFQARIFEDRYADTISIDTPNFTADVEPDVTRDHTITLSTTDAPLGLGHIVLYDSGTEIARAEFNVVNEGGGDSAFTFTANRAGVVAALNGSSEDVTYTLTSVGGFDGPVRVSFAPSDHVSPQPDTNNFILNVSPGTPTTFVRKFYWYDSDWWTQVPMVYTAHATQATAPDQSVTVTVDRATG